MAKRVFLPTIFICFINKQNPGQGGGGWEVK